VATLKFWYDGAKMAKNRVPARKRMSVHIGRAGRLVLPADVRRALHIQAGDEMVLSLEPEGLPGAVRLETVQAAIERAQRIVTQTATAGELMASEELIQERRAAAELE
jgi:AbrB family looped-hinge helix DNA binding protein